MSSLSANDVSHLAKLAQINLKKAEVGSLKTQLSEVIDYFKQLQEVPTDNVVSTSQTTGLEDVLRKDAVDSTRILSQEEALSGTENTHNGYFVVPQVINKDQ